MKPSKQNISEKNISEKNIRKFLEETPDFFERNSDLLNSLKLTHNSGEAVSLIEKQISVLRQKELKYERKLNELMEVARTNDALVKKIHKLALQLINATNLSEAISLTENSLRSDFHSDQAILIFFQYDPLKKIEINSRFFKSIDPNNSQLKPFNTFLKDPKARCGQIRDSQRDFLFGKDTDEVGSAALIPLGDEKLIGFLGIGSSDSNRFHPGMSMEFLNRLGELITVTLKRY